MAARTRKPKRTREQMLADLRRALAMARTPLERHVKAQALARLEREMGITPGGD